MGLGIDFSEVETRYVPGREKVWRTIGEPRLFIIDSYEMRVDVEKVTETSAKLTIAIDYELPRAFLWRQLGQMLAEPYAGWCLGSMIDGTKRDLERNAS